jgi:hypothetical protein
MSHPHWTLFEVIDEDLHAFSRQVEFAQPNFSTYSVTLLRLYLSICSEVDVVAKLLCQRTGANLSGRPNMDDYRKCLKVQHPNLSGVRVTIRPMALPVLPWQTWDQDKNPDWWQKHQLVKHQRDQHYPNASLENVLQSAAGLLVFLVYWHWPELCKHEVNPTFQIFEVEGVRRGIEWVPTYELKDLGKST